MERQLCITLDCGRTTTDANQCMSLTRFLQSTYQWLASLNGVAFLSRHCSQRSDWSKLRLYTWKEFGEQYQGQLSFLTHLISTPDCLAVCFKKKLGTRCKRVWSYWQVIRVVNAQDTGTKKHRTSWHLNTPSSYNVLAYSTWCRKQCHSFIHDCLSMYLSLHSLSHCKHSGHSTQSLAALSAAIMAIKPTWL